MSQGMRPKYVGCAASGPGGSVQFRCARVELVLYALSHSQERLSERERLE